MIEIKPIALEQLNTYRMAVMEKDRILGSVDIYLQDERAYLSHLVAGDLDAALSYGLGKAALNMADLRGAKAAFCTEPDMEAFLAPLRFQKESDSLWVVSLEKYFEAGCHASSEVL